MFLLEKEYTKTYGDVPVKVMMAGYWNIKPCNLVDKFRDFAGACYIILQTWR